MSQHVIQDNPTTLPASGARERIVSYIESEIEKGHLLPGEKVPSRMKLAKRFQVSAQTVTTAIRDLSDRGVVAHVAGRGVHVAAVARQAERVLTIGIIGWYAGHLDCMVDGGGIGGYWGGAFNALTRFAHESGYGLLLIPQTDQEPLDVDQIMAHQPDVIVSVGIQLNPETVFEFRRRNVQLLLGNRHLEQLGVCYVDYDTEGDFRRMVRIFHDRGHDRIAVILQKMRIGPIEERCFEGFCSELAMRDCVYPYRQYWRVHDLRIEDGRDEERWRSKAREEMLAMLDMPEPPTAVYCRFKAVAQGIADAAEARGLVLGRDMSVLCEANGDEDDPWSAFVVPQEELGRETVDTLRRMIEDPHRVYQVDVPKTFLDKGSIARLK